MAIVIQLRGGTTTENAGFTGKLREVTVDTQTGRLHVHDGATAGGKATIPTQTDMAAGLAKKAELSHTHTTAQVQGLDAALAAKAVKADVDAKFADVDEALSQTDATAASILAAFQQFNQENGIS